MERPGTIQTQKDIHLRRKIFHALSVLTILACMVLLPTHINWKIYLFIGLPLVGLDLVRLRNPSLNRWLVERMSSILRTRELRKLTGGSYAILGVGLSYLIFPDMISQISVLFLALGDPSASYFGIRFGKRKVFGKKSWAGSFAALAVCSIAAFVFLKVQGLELPLYWYIILGLCGAIAELIPLGVDDNLSQPLVSAALITLISLLLSGGLI